MNERVIKIAHIAALAVLMLAGVIVAAQQNGSTGQQNTNRNTNASGNMNSNASGNMNANSGHQMNSNAGNMNRGGNSNSNSGGNRNAGGGTGGQGGALGTTDRNFVMEAAMSGMAEVELGRLAVERGSSDAVKQFGQRMVDDHTRANEELMQLVSGLGLALPTTLGAKHRAAVNKMSRLSGAQFDRAYSKQMVADHQKAVSLFQREADRGTHAELKTFAGGKLPALQEHLSMARQLEGSSRGKQTTGSTR
jgi:putative membrane protein